MKLSDFDFHLPEENIALRPVSPRDSARLLVVRPGQTPALTDSHVRDLLGHLRAGDVMVFNNTRVIPARFSATRKRGETTAKVEITLHKRHAPDSWVVFAKPGKRLQVGDVVELGASLTARVAHKEPSGDVTLVFDIAGGELDAAIASVGIMPLPPYIAQKRPTDASDSESYQTVYATEDGAVAAPTAGLHFTPELLAAIHDKGVEIRYVTLHVGAGTFLPVKTENLAEHKMHSEWGVVSADTAAAINTARQRGGRLICVGTTSLRLIESAAAETGEIRAWTGDTDIFITPGYRFRAVDVLMTNFHLPKSTLVMLVSAFAGYEIMKAAYAHAIASGYRFYSYGDSSLLYRAS
jgi:S-adenosylmethionine:tRNA ribosyltransferase-isomerase